MSGSRVPPSSMLFSRSPVAYRNIRPRFFFSSFLLFLRVIAVSCVPVLPAAVHWLALCNLVYSLSSLLAGLDFPGALCRLSRVFFHLFRLSKKSGYFSGCQSQQEMVPRLCRRSLWYVYRMLCGVSAEGARKAHDGVLPNSRGNNRTS